MLNTGKQWMGNIGEKQVSQLNKDLRPTREIIRPNPSKSN